MLCLRSSNLPGADAWFPYRVRVSMLQRLVAWFPVLAWAAAIFALSAQPNLRFVPDEGLDLVVRKIGHMGVFGILALLAWYALARTAAMRPPWAWAGVGSVLYAISDELHQGLTAGRHPSPVDVGIDTVGIVVALTVVGFVRARWAGRGAVRRT